MSLSPANPFATQSDRPFRLPDFAALEPQHYAEAMTVGMAENLDALRALAADPAPPTAENVLDAWGRSSDLLTRAVETFYSVKYCDASAALSALEEEFAPKLAAHNDAVFMDAALYGRLRALAERAAVGEAALDAEQAWVLDDLLATFVRNGVALAADDQETLRGYNQRLAELETQFEKTNLAARNAGAITVADAAALDGLSAEEIATMATDSGYTIELVNTSAQPVIERLTDRDLRRRIYEASVTRGVGRPLADGTPGPDTRAIIVEMARLRAQRATLLGYPNHAALVTERACAGNTEAVADMLGRLGPAALAQAKRDAMELSARFAELYPGETFAPWDWAYVAEIVRRERFDLDLDALAPYLSTDKVLAAVYGAAERLYGISFAPRPDLRGHTADADVFEVRDADGSVVGLFVMDFWARPTKQGGAWMTNLVNQSHLLGDVPIVTNNCNYTRGTTAISWDGVITMFHEFGHALHGLFADTRYASHSGTNTPRDFVEFPSQVNEHWAWEPDAVIPAEAAERMRAADRFNQGFGNYEAWVAMILDQAWHTTPLDELPASAEEVEAFEARALEAAGMTYDLIPPRYRSPYFAHIWSSYDAAYYSYVWSEVMDADAVAWFEAHGGGTRENGEHFRRTLLAPGGSVNVMDTWRTFAGHEPDLGPLLKRKGIEADPAEGA